jgi:hypothetical protein
MSCCNLAYGVCSRVSQCVRAYVYEGRVFVSMVLILIFSEVLGLYGSASPSHSRLGANAAHRLIVALLMNSKVAETRSVC